VLNLAILLVMLRRWRELEPTGGLPTTGAVSNVRMIDRIPSFSASALDGTAVTERTLLGKETLVGFFSLTCKACVEAVPVFAGHAERLRPATYRAEAPPMPREPRPPRSITRVPASARAATRSRTTSSRSFRAVRIARLPPHPGVGDDAGGGGQAALTR